MGGGKFKSEHDSSYAAHEAADSVGDKLHTIGIDAAVFGGLLVVAKGDEIPTIDGLIQKNSGDDGQYQEDDHRHGYRDPADDIKRDGLACLVHCQLVGGIVPFFSAPIAFRDPLDKRHGQGKGFP